MDVVSDVINLWPSPDKFAEAIGVRRTTVNVWRHRKSIPVEHWAAIEAAAMAAGINGASASDLARIVASKRLLPDGQPGVAPPSGPC